jgi:hypothetical protein
VPEAGYPYSRRVNWLTRQEQIVLATVLALLVAGWAVKTYRTAHPPAKAETAAMTVTNAVNAGNE